jgi:acetolactate synthase I/II/III large subunit
MVAAWHTLVGNEAQYQIGRLSPWWRQIDVWRSRKAFAYSRSSKVIKPQYAIEQLYALTRGKDVYVTTEVGQHQMWAAQFFHFDQPNRWMTSGGLGTMGYGLPAAIGVQLAHPRSTVIDIAGEASVLMNMQELSTAVQYRLPVKIFILNNEHMGMIRQWQEMLHEERYSHSYSESLPDFVMLAKAYGAVGIRAEHPDELDEKILEMLASPGPVLFDCRVEKTENCLPMIPSGKAHNEMILADEFGKLDCRSTWPVVAWCR